MSSPFVKGGKRGIFPGTLNPGPYTLVEEVNR
jgi:hypothetical protein